MKIDTDFVIKLTEEKSLCVKVDATYLPPEEYVGGEFEIDSLEVSLYDEKTETFKDLTQDEIKLLDGIFKIYDTAFGKLERHIELSKEYIKADQYDA